MSMIKPDIKKLNELIADCEIDKNNIEYHFIQHKLFDIKIRKVKNKNKTERKKVSPIANRTFAGIFAGNKIKESSLEALSKLFTKILKSNGSNRIISASDLINEQNFNPKNVLRLIRNYNDLIDSGETLIPLIPFFNINLKKDTEPLINNLLSHIDTIMSFTFKHIAKPIEENRTQLREYENELKIISEVNSIIEELVRKDIYLYVGDLKNVPELISSSNKRDISKHSQDPDVLDPTIVQFDLSVKTRSATYKIFNFTGNYGEFIEAKYKPAFNHEELDKILKKAKKKFTYTVTEEDHQNYKNTSYEGPFDWYLHDQHGLKCMTDFTNENYQILEKTDGLNFPFNFERPRLSFQYNTKKYHSEDYKEGVDPVFDNYLAENDLTYEEAMELAEDQYAEMQTNFIRGK